MFFKYDIGDLVFLTSQDNSDNNAGILHITIRDFAILPEDILPHKYYYGTAFPMVKDENSGLFVPIHLALGSSWKEPYGAVFSSGNRESKLKRINSKIIDLEKLLPYITHFSKINH